MAEDFDIEYLIGIRSYNDGRLIRGGNWNNGLNSGLFTANLNNLPSNTNTNIGFRCARYPCSF